MKTQTTRTKPDPNFQPATWPGGYFHAPQAIRDLLKRERISGMIQAQILLEINGEMGRQGEDGKPAEWARGLTIPKFAIACGRTKKRTAEGDEKQALSGVEKALADLRKRGLIQREPDGKTWTKAGVQYASAWKYRIDPFAWKSAPKYEPVVENEADDAPQDEDPSQPDVQAKTWPADMLMSMPGRGSKPFTIGQAVQRVRIAANATEMPIAARFRVAENGDLEIRIERFEKPSEVPGTYLPRTQEAPSDSKGVNPKSTVLEDGANANAQPSLPDSDPPPDPLEEYVIREVEPLTGNAVLPETLSAVRSKLNGTPLEYLKDRVRARASKYTSHELLPHLADDARVRYQRAKRLDAAHTALPTSFAAEAPPWTYNGPYRKEGVEADLKNWETLPPEYRDYYRRALPERTKQFEGGRS